MSQTLFDIGFLGGGQLARMSIQAASKMGIRCVSLDPTLASPASFVGAAIQGELNDPNSIRKLATQSCAVTLENEFIPADAITTAFQGLHVSMTPSIPTLAVIQDKLRQRQAYDAAKVPSPPAFALEGPFEPVEQALGYPMVLKSRFGGYDGKGTLIAKDRAFVEQARPIWEKGGWLAEKFMPFSRELSAMVVRTPTYLLCLPVMETYQPNQVCDVTLPAAMRHENSLAAKVAVDAVKAVNGYGLFGVELFELPNGGVTVNEIAPRPHNTGHYTLDWGRISQFELHVRVALGMPLPPQTELDGLPVAMVNLFGVDGAGDFRKGLQSLLAFDPCARFHWYEKAEAKPGRKMGHVNLDLNNLPDGVVGPDAVIQYMLQLRAAFEEGWKS